MELRHLRYFVAVAEEENITRAAERLHLSQPPLSRQIRDLEEEVGVPLLERNARSVRLTEAGRVFLEEARIVLWRASQAVTAARAAGKKIELHLGYAPSPTGEFLSPLLQAFEKAIPQARVVLHDLSSSEMLAGLRSGRLHATLMVEPAGRLPRGLRFERLRASPIGVIVSKSHPLAKRRRVAKADVIREPLAVFRKEDYPDYHQVLRASLGVPSSKLRIAEECDGALSLIAAVEASRTIAVSTESIISVAGSRVVFVRLSPAPPAINVGICHTDTEPLLPALRRFIETARSVVASAARTPH